MTILVLTINSIKIFLYKNFLAFASNFETGQDNIETNLGISCKPKIKSARRKPSFHIYQFAFTLLSVATRTVSLPNRIRSEIKTPRRIKGACNPRRLSRTYSLSPNRGWSQYRRHDRPRWPTFTTANGVPVNNDATPMLWLYYLRDTESRMVAERMRYTGRGMREEIKWERETRKGIERVVSLSLSRESAVD